MDGIFEFIEKFSSDDRGAAAVEYALLLAIVASGIAVAAGTFSSSITGALSTASDCIAEEADCTP